MKTIEIHQAINSYNDISKSISYQASQIEALAPGPGFKDVYVKVYLDWTNFNDPLYTYNERFGYCIGATIGSTNAYQRVACLDYYVTLPSNVTNLSRLQDFMLTDRIRHAIVVLRLFSSTVTKISDLFASSQEYSNGHIEILDLRGLSNLKSLSYLVDHDRSHYPSGGNIYWNNNFPEHILYPSNTIEEIDSWLQNISLNSFVAKNIQLPKTLITEIFLHKWPKLKRITNMVQDSKNANGGGGWMNYTPPYGIEWPLATLYDGSVLDFGCMPVLESAEGLLAGDQWTNIQNMFSQGIRLTGIGNKNKPCNITNIANVTNLTVLSLVTLNTTGEISSYQYGISEPVKFVINGGGEPATGGKKVSAGIITGRMTSYPYYYNHANICINTGDSGLDNEIHQQLPNATVGVPVGWTHLFSRN